MRRKRLDSAYKMILVEKLEEKKYRQSRVYDGHKTRAKESYAKGIHTRDAFNDTMYSTKKEALP